MHQGSENLYKGLHPKWPKRALSADPHKFGIICDAWTDPPYDNAPVGECRLLVRNVDNDVVDIQKGRLLLFRKCKFVDDFAAIAVFEDTVLHVSPYRTISSNISVFSPSSLACVEFHLGKTSVIAVDRRFGIIHILRDSQVSCIKLQEILKRVRWLMITSVSLDFCEGSHKGRFALKVVANRKYVFIFDPSNLDILSKSFDACAMLDIHPLGYVAP